MTRVTRFTLIAALLMIVPLSAQQVQQVAALSSTDVAGAPAVVLPVAAPSIPALLVVAGGSTVVKTDFPVTRIAVTNPDVADATVIDPKQVLVDGKNSGSISLIVWGQQEMLQYAVTVFPPTPTLQRQL